MALLAMLMLISSNCSALSSSFSLINLQSAPHLDHHGQGVAGLSAHEHPADQGHCGASISATGAQASPQLADQGSVSLLAGPPLPLPACVGTEAVSLWDGRISFAPPPLYYALCVLRL